MNKTWHNTKVTQLLNIDYPILQGPFGRGGSTPELTAAVSNAGGLGGYGANTLEPEEIRKVGTQIRALTNKPFGINLWVSTFDHGGDVIEQSAYELVMKALEPFYLEMGLSPTRIPSGKPKDFAAQMSAVFDVNPSVFSFVFGIPEGAILDECRKRKIATIGAATTVEEAEALADAGVDLVIASGVEAGGHRPTFLKSAEVSAIGLLSLMPQCVDAVNIPVIAAGGIADGRGIVAALKLGAAGVQVGTAFLACDESGASDYHRQLLFSKEGRTTSLSNAYTGRLARGIHNRFAAELKPFEAQLAKYPAQSWIVEPLKKAAIEQGRYDLVALWAGQSASLCKHHNATELMNALVDETNTLW